MKAIINTTLYDYDNLLKNAYIIFDETIKDIGYMEDFIDHDYEIIDGQDQIILPGFIVGHTHIYSTFARGLSLPFNPKNFQDILDQMWWKLDGALTNEATYYSGIVSAVDMMKNGVTTVIDHHASKEIKGSLLALKSAVVDEAGMRGAFCFETSDRFDVEACIKENTDFIKNNQTDFVTSHFGLHASMSLSEATLKKVKEVLGNTPIHIHAAESELDQLDAQKKYGKRVIERLDDAKLLNEDSIITHALYINDNECELLKKRGCVVALNPNSNMNNGVGLPNYKQLKRFNIPVIVGNDGLSTTITSDILALLYGSHLKENDPLALGINDILDIIITSYTYASKRFNTLLGKFNTNYQADLISVPYIPPTPLNESNVMGHLFYGMFHSLKPKHVFIKGKQTVNNYTVSASLTKQYKEAQKVSESLWHNLTKEAS